MLFHPEETIGIIRKTQTDAEECIKNISTLMKKEEIKQIFKAFHGKVPEFTGDKNDRIEFSFKKTVTREGNINAFSVMTSSVGSHVKRAIFDDFVTIDDRLSKACREKTKVMLEEYVNNILAPNGTCGFIGTPWHKMDAWISPGIPHPLRFDVYSTKLMAENEILEKKSKMSHVSFAANYELELVASDDVIFSPAKYAPWEFRYKNGIGGIDKKYEGTDTNALVFISKKENGRYQGFGKVWTENIKTLYDEIKSLHQKYGIGTIYSEKNDDKGFVTDKLATMGIPVIAYHENMNKHIKILNHLKENGFWDMIDWTPETDPDFIAQIEEYNEGMEPDDASDICSVMGKILISAGAEAFRRRWKK